MPGPLAGVRVIEFAGLGPGPFAAMLLADHGAEVIRIERPNAENLGDGVLERSRRSVVIDLKRKEGAALALRLCCSADALIEGFRPGVMERMGLGPQEVHAANPKLVYARMTGWGQTGPKAHRAGHDINYIALSGALHAFGRKNAAPTAPLNMVGDMGGGGMFLAFGIVSAVLHARAGGRGQVVDCAMSDGSALLMATVWGMTAQGRWRQERGVNLLDSGAPFYDAYETADGQHIAVGAIEPKFYNELLSRIGAHDSEFANQMAQEDWPRLKERFADIFRTRTREEWCALLEDTDACVAPVLPIPDAAEHPHNQARRTFIDVGGVRQPAPAPRYSLTAPDDPRPPPRPGADTDRILAEAGVAPGDIAALRADGVIA